MLRCRGVHAVLSLAWCVQCGGRGGGGDGHRDDDVRRAEERAGLEGSVDTRHKGGAQGLYHLCSPASSNIVVKGGLCFVLQQERLESFLIEQQQHQGEKNTGERKKKNTKTRATKKLEPEGKAAPLRSQSSSSTAKVKTPEWLTW